MFRKVCAHASACVHAHDKFERKEKINEYEEIILKEEKSSLHIKYTHGKPSQIKQMIHIYFLC